MNNVKRNQKRNLLLFFMLLIGLIGVGYAILQANLQINGTTKIANNTWDVHFANIQVNEDSVSIGDGDSAATIDSNNNCKVDFSVTLSVPGDFYEFTVDVVNAGTIDGMIGTLTKVLKVDGVVVDTVPSYLNYTVTYADGSEILSNHLLAKNTQETYKVRVEYKTDIDELPDATTISTSIEPVFLQADDTAIKKPPYNPCTYDGELVQGAEYTNGQYTYRYMQENGYNSSTKSTEWQNIDNDGWGVTLTDKESTEPVTSKLCTSINDKPIVSMKYMFYNSKTTNIDTSSFNTSNVTNMFGMLYNCSSLTTLDLSNFDTSNVTNMSGMFASCSSLTDIDVTEFDTSNVTNMSGMFSNCSNLNEVDVTKFDTSKVTDMSGMFSGCSSFTTLDLSNFDTSNVTNMYAMFQNCSSLTTLDLSGFNFSNYNPSSLMFNVSGGFSSLKVLNMTGAKLPSILTYAFGGLSTVEQIILDDVDTSLATTMNGMFNGDSRLTSLNLSSFDTSNVTNMDSMFNECSSLITLDLSSFNTSNVTKANGMLSSCSHLVELNLSGFVFSNFNSGSIMMNISGGGFSSLKVLNMTGAKLPSNLNYAFGGLGTVEQIILDDVDTSLATTMQSMFNGCISLKSINVSHFNTSNVTNMTAMFNGCSRLSSLDLTAFDTSHVTKMDAMFLDCSNLTNIDVSHFNTSLATTMSSMFSGCSRLTTLDLSSFNTSNVTNTDNMFNGCTSLTTGYARTQADADKFNNSSYKPSGVTFVVKI